jgi:hypothetical protein
MIQNAPVKKSVKSFQHLKVIADVPVFLFHFEPGSAREKAIGIKRMIRIFLIILCATIAGHAQDNVIVDIRDGRNYRTVAIGEQAWMAENLAFRISISHVLYPNWDLKGKEREECFFCYKDDLKNCDQYGVLYTWEGAKNACPVDWHLPSQEEFELLITNTDKRRKDAYSALIRGGKSGFDAVFGGALFHYDTTIP